MASHVVIIDSAARRHQIKTTPSKTLSEVLEETCTKLKLSPSQYGLKHNNKQIDLSRTIRLSGLTSGAKLEIVQLSKSAGVVSVALQLPESESRGLPNGRLTDKFPSTTTLWLLLRKFEAGVAGGQSTRNLTAKAAPSTGSGAGRLFYEQPVIQIMGRELASFTDLQKTLSQLGFNSGSTLLRLSYRATQKPLEEAIAEIQGYFDSVDSQAPPPQAQHPLPIQQLEAAAGQSDEPASQITQPTGVDLSVTDEMAIVPDSSVIPDQSTPPQTNTPVVLSGNREVSVFTAPTASTPSAALRSYNESDYTPTIEHAQAHQKMLLEASQNKRLPTDAELASQAAAKKEEWAAIKEVEIKIRFPDQSSVSAKFQQSDTTADLYNFARGCLDARLRDEAFILKNPGVRGKGENVPDDAKKYLIHDIHLRGRVLVVFGWDEQKASAAARSAKEVLKEELRIVAQEPTAPEIPSLSSDADDGIKVNVGKGKEVEKEGDSKGKKLPKWLKGLAKK